MIKISIPLSFLFSFFSFYSCYCDSVIIEELVLENSWLENPIGFSGISEMTAEYGEIRYYPSQFRVLEDKLVFLEYSTGKIFIYDTESDSIEVIESEISRLRFFFQSKGLIYVSNRSELLALNLNTGNFEAKSELTPKTRGIVDGIEYGDKLYMTMSTDFNFATISDGNIDAIDIESYYAAENLDFNVYTTNFHENILYSTSNYNEEPEKNYMTDKIIAFDYLKKKIKIIDARDHDFGYLLLGVDNRGRFYTANNWSLERIYVHDRRGRLIHEIPFDVKKYGDEPTDMMNDGSFMHLPFVTKDGEIYIMLRLDDGIYVVRFSES